MKQYQYDAIVVGSGAAGYAAADRLQQSGVKSLAMITEDRLSGTSRNTGSDKQTYYKLTLTGKEPDSVFEMAQTLFEGGAVDGDLALLEAAGSVRCFLHLVEEGVPFPANDYGEYVGYKTDHDPAKRATSAGPLTSRYMTECLEKKVLSAHIDYFDRHPLLRILAVDGQVEGLLCYSLESHEEVLFASRHIVYATGGPAGLYARSVYPGSQHGASGLAFEAGARGKNLTEWQYGIASTSFRWNLSGTYQQVLPRYLSTNAEGEDEREFLLDSMTAEEALARTFLKGYQWPFDPRKIEGSSRIDMLVYEETEIKGRRVFLDYTNNPTGLKDDFSNIGEEAYEYLSNSEALFGTPFDRLAKMNPRAIDLYRSHGIDLESERLEIAVCAQHNNGGLAADAHWESHVKGLYPVGEVCGSHGIYRPGGSALNAGQVGALRAAQAIRAALEKETPVPLSEEALHLAQELLDQLRSLKKGESNIARILKRIQARMSLNCAQIRELGEIQRVADEARSELETFWQDAVIDASRVEDELIRAMNTYDLLVAQYVYATAMSDAIQHDIYSRGSYLVVDGVEGTPLIDDGTHNGFVQEISLNGLETETIYRPVRPIPESEQWFERVYNS